MDPCELLGVGSLARFSWRIGDHAITADAIVRGPCTGSVYMYAHQACLLADVFQPASWRERAKQAEDFATLADHSLVDPHISNLALPAERYGLAI